MTYADTANASGTHSRRARRFMTTLAVVVLGVLNSATDCWGNHPTHPIDTAYSNGEIAGATGNLLSASPVSKTATWPALHLRAEGSGETELLKLETVSVTLQDTTDTSGNRVCRATFRARINKTGWCTAAQFNGDRGQIFFVEFFNNLGGQIATHYINPLQISADTPNDLVTSEQRFDIDIYSTSVKVAIGAKSYEWQSCR